MQRVNKQSVNFYEFKELKVPHAFLGREYNFLSSLSRKELSLQYENVKKVMGVDKIALVNQIHSNQIKIVTKENYLESNASDGMLTNEKGIALATKVADCQAILLYDEKRQVIGNIHSGWKGTVGRILQTAITLMQDTYACEVKDIKVYFCPSICQDCFEVKEDVYLLFKETFLDIDLDQFVFYSKEKDRYFIDTVGINKELVLQEGILKENIIVSELCTKCNPTLFHSYRVDKENSGRNLAIICL